MLLIKELNRNGCLHTHLLPSLHHALRAIGTYALTHKYVLFLLKEIWRDDYLAPLPVLLNVGVHALIFSVAVALRLLENASLAAEVGGHRVRLGG